MPLFVSRSVGVGRQSANELKRRSPSTFGSGVLHRVSISHDKGIGCPRNKTRATPSHRGKHKEIVYFAVVGQVK